MSAIIHSSQSLNPSASLRLNSANAQQPISFPFSSQLQREQRKQKNGVGIPKGQVIREDYLVKKVLAKEMEELVKGQRNVPLVVDFYATWCDPCILIAQELETGSK